MKTLETRFTEGRRFFRLVKRIGNAALYEVRSPETMDLYGFELIIVQVHPADEIMGRQYPEREGFPANSDWGSKGWSFGNNQKRKALAAFNGLAKKNRFING